MKISVNQAQDFINRYCDDAPLINAEQLADIELPLFARGNNRVDWVEIVPGLGLYQDDIDDVLYTCVVPKVKAMLERAERAQREEV